MGKNGSKTYSCARDEVVEKIGGGSIAIPKKDQRGSPFSNSNAVDGDVVLRRVVKNYETRKMEVIKSAERE